MPATAERDNPNEEWTVFLAEIEQLRNAISTGELKQRLVPESHSNEASTACHVINQILDTIIHTFDLAVTSVDGMCIGRISEPFQDGFPGLGCATLRLVMGAALLMQEPP